MANPPLLEGDLPCPIIDVIPIIHWGMNTSIVRLGHPLSSLKHPRASFSAASNIYGQCPMNTKRDGDGLPAR